MTPKLSALKLAKLKLSAEQHLSGLANGRAPENKEFGICYSLEHVLLATEYLNYSNLISELASEWPKHSGYAGFPIPSAEDFLTAKECYYTEALWEGKQGKLRRELALHCKHELVSWSLIKFAESLGLEITKLY